MYLCTYYPYIVSIIIWCCIIIQYRWHVIYVYQNIYITISIGILYNIENSNMHFRTIYSGLVTIALQSFYLITYSICAGWFNEESNLLYHIVIRPNGNTLILVAITCLVIIFGMVHEVILTVQVTVAVTGVSCGWRFNVSWSSGAGAGIVRSKEIDPILNLVCWFVLVVVSDDFI